MERLNENAREIYEQACARMTMQTITRTYPDGTKGAYTAAPGSDLFLRLSALKPAKRPALARSHKRLFPAYVAGVTSTSDYIKAYYGLNTRPYGKIYAYDNAADHLALYAPLPDAPAALYTGVDTVETVEGEE